MSFDRQVIFFSIFDVVPCDRIRGRKNAERVSGVIKEMEKLSKIVRSYPLKEGENKTEIPFVSIYYREQRAKRTCSHGHLATAAGFFDFSTERKIDMPRVDNFYIYLVLDGSVRLYTPSGIMDYLAGQYSVRFLRKTVSAERDQHPAGRRDL